MTPDIPQLGPDAQSMRIADLVLTELGVRTERVLPSSVVIEPADDGMVKVTWSGAAELSETRLLELLEQVSD